MDEGKLNPLGEIEHFNCVSLSSFTPLPEGPDSTPCQHSHWQAQLLGFEDQEVALLHVKLCQREGKCHLSEEGGGSSAIISLRPNAFIL